MSNFDVIIVNYKSTDHLKTCLASIYANLSGLYATVFVQDNSPGTSISEVARHYPQVKITRNKSNLGFTKAVNAALIKGNSPLVVLLNPDTQINNDLFSKTYDYMRANGDVGILGPKILSSDGSIQGSARSFPTPLTALFGRNTYLTTFFPNNPISRKNVLTTQSNDNAPMEVDWVSGACMIIRRKAIADTGLLDEQFFMYWEDADWCRRMWQKGWKVLYFPQTTVLHHVGQSSKTRVLGAEWDFHMSAYRLFSKYAQGSSVLLKPIVALGLSGRFMVLLIRHWCRRLIFQR